MAELFPAIVIVSFLVFVGSLLVATEFDDSTNRPPVHHHTCEHYHG